MHAVGGTPDIVIEVAGGRLRRIIGSTTENPDAALKDGTPADHPPSGPVRLLRLDLLPVHAVLCGPDIAVENFVRSGGNKARHRLSAEHPDAVSVHDRLMQHPRPPRHRPVAVDELPVPSILGVPHVVLIVVLIRVTSDDPHAIAKHGVTRGMSPLPVGG